MAVLNPQAFSETGLAPSTSAAAAGGDQFENTGREIVAVTNGGGSSVTVTVAAQSVSKDVPGYGTMTKANGGGAVAAGVTKYFGPFPTRAYNNASGRVSLSYSSTTSVTVAVLRLHELPNTL